MSDEAAPAGASALPEVDDVLADALVAQGEAGVRALGLLRDARRVLTGSGFARPAEVAAACVRSAADALLGLPGAPVTVGLKPAAQGLLAAVDAVEVSGGGAPSAGEDFLSGGPALGAGSAGTDEAAGGLSGVSAEASTGWERITEAAQVLRTELERPGRYHQARARGIVERLMGVELGAAEDAALDVWGTVYGVASGILHGRTANADEAVLLYTDILSAARELLVPLPARAARVLELAALTGPGAAEAKEVAGWADPRASAYFFRSAPAAGWLDALQEYAPHMLMPDRAADGYWPAEPFLGYLAAAAPDTAGPWLAGHAEDIVEAGAEAANALLRLAAHDGIVLAPQVRSLVAGLTGPGAVPVDFHAARTLHLAAKWACAVPQPARDGDWIIVAELLLTYAVESEHVARAALQEAASDPTAVGGALVGGPASPAAANVGHVVADVPDDFARDEDRSRARVMWTAACRLPEYDVASLVRELVRTAYPAGLGGGPHPRVAMIRAVAAGLLRRDLELTSPAARHIVFHADLDQVRMGDSAAFGGPRLARAVLDLAAMDAHAGVGLNERVKRWKRFAEIDEWLHSRLLASHLTRCTPTVDIPAVSDAGDGAVDEPGGGGERQRWWQQVVALVARLVAAEPAPEPARLVDLALDTCPPEHAGQLEADVRTAFGEPPATTVVDEVLPADAGQIDGLAEPLASWLRVWDWSPVLPARLLSGWEPVMTALYRIVPEGPADPRTSAEPQPVKPLEREAGELEELAAGHGPVAAAARLAAADAGDTVGHILLVHRLVAANPAAWTADVPAVVTAFERPELAAIYLGAAVQHSAAFPHGVVQAAVAALDVHRAVAGPGTPSAGPGLRTGVVFLADQALFGLLTATWRSGGDLAADLPRALTYLYTLAAHTPTREGAGPAEEAGSAGMPDEERQALLIENDPAGRAVRCLLEYAVHEARTTGLMPEDVLDVVAGTLDVRGDQDAVAAAVGVYLPHLHRYAPAFAAAHRAELYSLAPGRPSPAASWLHGGSYDQQLLAALDRTELLAALRSAAPGAAEKVAYALLDDPTILGEPMVLWRELAVGDGGVAAVSRLLEAVAARTPRAGSVALLPATTALVGAATAVWRAAVAAGLPAGALEGTGAFADAAIDDVLWLELARASAEQSTASALVDADLVAERAAGHPGSSDALLLAALLVSHPGGMWRHDAVRRHARALLDAAAPLVEGERLAALEKLRTALVNSGDVDAARP
ncbi:hypothetical protein [Streptomyces griseorubiginosus]|uniref:hypothetical protein n=1 Tax=Streptomyces griseorubiginosus TaxID=67304 RepID=UPI0036ECDA03